MSILPLGGSPSNFVATNTPDSARADDRPRTEDGAVARGTPPPSATETSPAAPIAAPEPGERPDAPPPERTDDAFAEREAAAQSDASVSEAEAVAVAALEADTPEPDDTAAVRAAADAYAEQARIQQAEDQTPPDVADPGLIAADEADASFEPPVPANEPSSPDGPSAGDNPLDKVA